jgi:hypothetical protein
VRKQQGKRQAEGVDVGGMIIFDCVLENRIRRYGVE